MKIGVSKCKNKRCEVCNIIIEGKSKIKLEEHKKAVVRGEIEKSGMADHIWKERGNHLPLWNEAEIIDSVEH